MFCDITAALLLNHCQRILQNADTKVTVRLTLKQQRTKVNLHFSRVWFKLTLSIFIHILSDHLRLRSRIQPSLPLMFCSQLEVTEASASDLTPSQQGQEPAQTGSDWFGAHVGRESQTGSEG